MFSHRFQLCSLVILWAMITLPLTTSAQTKGKDDFTGYVGELNDKFLNVYKQDVGKGWMVQFYAPWCHHCRQMGKTCA
jgi:thiol-disulfide isomerase/thioredoxin